jgi:hypothetical protein
MYPARKVLVLAALWLLTMVPSFGQSLSASIPDISVTEIVCQLPLSALVERPKAAFPLDAKQRKAMLSNTTAFSTDFSPTVEAYIMEGFTRVLKVKPVENQLYAIAAMYLCGPACEQYSVQVFRFVLGKGWQLDANAFRPFSEEQLLTALFTRHDWADFEEDEVLYRTELTVDATGTQLWVSYRDPDDQLRPLMPYSFSSGIFKP